MMINNPLKKGDTLKIYTDGAARGNPGPAAIAFLFVHDDNVIHNGVDYIGHSTNNIAEYQAIINALKVSERFSRGHVQVFSDSNLAIQQINKKWKINKPHLSALCSEVYRLRKKYEKVDFFHVGRSNSYIQKCDYLCNKRLDEEGFNSKRNQ
jgi:ribonuclease HI